VWRPSLCPGARFGGLAVAPQRAAPRCRGSLRSLRWRSWFAARRKIPRGGLGSRNRATLGRVPEANPVRPILVNSRSGHFPLGPARLDVLLSLCAHIGSWRKPTTRFVRPPFLHQAVRRRDFFVPLGADCHGLDFLIGADSSLRPMDVSGDHPFCAASFASVISCLSRGAGKGKKPHGTSLFSRAGGPECGQPSPSGVCAAAEVTPIAGRKRVGVKAGAQEFMFARRCTYRTERVGDLSAW